MDMVILLKIARVDTVKDAVELFTALMDGQPPKVQKEIRDIIQRLTTMAEGF